MTRGEIWTASGGLDYGSKPRPVVVVQNDYFDATASVTVCPFTRMKTGSEMIRLPVSPSPSNGLMELSFLMVDKIATFSKAKLGRRIGILARADIIRLERAILLFLGLTP